MQQGDSNQTKEMAAALEKAMPPDVRCDIDFAYNEDRYKYRFSRIVVPKGANAARAPEPFDMYGIVGLVYDTGSLSPFILFKRESSIKTAGLDNAIGGGLRVNKYMSYSYQPIIQTETLESFVKRALPIIGYKARQHKIKRQRFERMQRYVKREKLRKIGILTVATIGIIAVLALIFGS